MADSADKDVHMADIEEGDDWVDVEIPRTPTFTPTLPALSTSAIPRSPSTYNSISTHLQNPQERSATPPPPPSPRLRPATPKRITPSERDSFTSTTNSHRAAWRSLTDMEDIDPRLRIPGAFITDDMEETTTNQQAQPATEAQEPSLPAITSSEEPQLPERQSRSTSSRFTTGSAGGLPTRTGLRDPSGQSRGLAPSSSRLQEPFNPALHHHNQYPQRGSLHRPASPQRFPPEPTRPRATEVGVMGKGKNFKDPFFHNLYLMSKVKVMKENPDHPWDAEDKEQLATFDATSGGVGVGGSTGLGAFAGVDGAFGLGGSGGIGRSTGLGNSSAGNTSGTGRSSTNDTRGGSSGQLRRRAPGPLVVHRPGTQRPIPATQTSTTTEGSTTAQGSTSTQSSTTTQVTNGDTTMKEADNEKKF